MASGMAVMKYLFAVVAAAVFFLSLPRLLEGGTGGVRGPDPGRIVQTLAGPSPSPETARVPESPILFPDPSGSPGQGKPREAEEPSRGPDEPAPSRVTAPSRIPPTTLLGDDLFVAAVRRASRGRLVMMAMGDRGFLPMLRNFLSTSVVRLGLDNCLIVAMQSGMCEQLEAEFGTLLMTCYTWPGGENMKGGNYGSKEFARMVNFKSEVVMAVLQLGYDAFLVDGDIVFKQNPVPIISSGDEDVVIQDDAEGGRNSGFMLVRARPQPLHFIGRSIAISNANPKSPLRQQPAINKALEEFRSRLKVRVLDTGRFPHGKKYFEQPRRMFAWDHPCKECVILHNNWIVSTTAKVFRFKEHLQWQVDDPEGYYSSTTARYLQVGNPNPKASKTDEQAMLEAAFRIGLATGRIVILPALRCHGCKVTGAGGSSAGCAGSPSDIDQCSFMAHYDIRTFISTVTYDRFREHMFRYNPLVPQGVSLEFTAGLDGLAAMEDPPEPPLFIAAENRLEPKFQGAEEVTAAHILMPSDIVAGPSGDEVAAWVGEVAGDAPVVRFHSLYGVHIRLSDSQEAEFRKIWQHALKSNSVRQY